MAPKRDWKTELHVLFGHAGSGKSELAQKEAGKEAYWKPTGPWADQYVGEENVVFDDFRGEIPRNEFWKLTDRYPHLAAVKGGHVQWVPKKIWVTSLNPPWEWWNDMSLQDMKATVRRISSIRFFPANGPPIDWMSEVNKILEL